MAFAALLGRLSERFECFAIVRNPLATLASWNSLDWFPLKDGHSPIGEKLDVDLAAALAKKPDDISVRTDLGLTFVFRENPDYDCAIKEFQASLQNNPNHLQSLQNITYAYIQKRDAQKAKEYLDRLVKVDPNNSSLPDLRSQIEKLGKS